MSTTIDIPADSSAAAKGKAPLIGSSSSSSHHGKVGVGAGGGGYKKGVAIFDFVIRIGALITAITAAAVMGNTEQTLPFFTQFFQFSASYDDLPTFQYFVISMAIVGSYVALSLPISIVSIIRPNATGPRLLLLILDTIALAMTTAAASAAAAIDYLAHNGNTSANWLAICNQFGDFCQEASGAVVAAFVAVVFFVVLIVVSAVALRKH